MLGSHLSISGGMVNALHAARRFRMDCVQVFTANQRQWAPRPPDEAQARAWLAALRDMCWDGDDAATTARVVSHGSYLLNLASPSPEIWRQSIGAQARELERCESLRIPLCVIHPGAHLQGARPAGDRRSRL